MALFRTSGGLIGGLLNTLGRAIGGPVGSALGIGGQAIGGISAASGPVVQTAVSAPPQVAIRPGLGAGASQVARGAATVIQGGKRILTAAAARGMMKMAQTLGRRTMSLRTAVRHIRKLGKFLGPAAVAAALGITAEEMADIILSDAARTRRRMNPANIHALRRSMRRISSFHRLAQKADMMRGSRRRSSRRASGACGPNITQVR